MDKLFSFLWIGFESIFKRISLIRVFNGRVFSYIVFFVMADRIFCYYFFVLRVSFINVEVLFILL